MFQLKTIRVADKMTKKYVTCCTTYTQSTIVRNLLTWVQDQPACLQCFGVIPINITGRKSDTKSQNIVCDILVMNKRWTDMIIDCAQRGNRLSCNGWQDLVTEHIILIQVRRGQMIGDQAMSLWEPYQVFMCDRKSGHVTMGTLPALHV